MEYTFSDLSAINMLNEAVTPSSSSASAALRAIFNAVKSIKQF